MMESQFSFTQRVGPLAHLPQLLEEFGVNPARLFHGSPISPSAVSSEESHIPFDQAVRLLAKAAELTKCQHIGLVLGSRMDAKIIGLAGQIMSTASILREALIDFLGIQPAYSSGAVFYLHRHGEDVLFGYGVYLSSGGVSQQAYDLSLAISYRTIQEITGGAALPLEVLVCHDKPADTRPYELLFKAPVRFNQSQAGLVYSRRALEMPIVTANPAERVRLLALLRQRYPGNQPFSQRVRHTLRPMLLFGGGSMNDVAEAFGMNSRRRGHWRHPDKTAHGWRSGNNRKITYTPIRHVPMHHTVGARCAKKNPHLVHGPT